jgi:signal transduction histidine kinase
MIEILLKTLISGLLSFVYQSWQVQLTGFLSYNQELTLFVTPTWVTSWWFLAIIVVICLMAGFTIYQFVKRRIENWNLTQKMEQKEKINQAKMSFVSSISEEILIPLSHIPGPLEKLIAENQDNPSLMKSLRMFSKNFQQLMRLGTQLLDLQKIDQNQMTVKYAQVDLVKFTSDIMHAFDHLADKKKIRFSMIAKPKRLPVWIDPDNIDKVLFNVLSNAFKFTPNKGDIEISVSTGKSPDSDSYLKEYAEILIHDTGIGIAEEELEQIFDRFYQIKNDHNKNSGTGIGLYLSRSLIKLQHGEIFAINRTDRPGSTFVIRIPLGKSHVGNSQIIHTQLPQKSTEEQTDELKENIRNVLANRERVWKMAGIDIVEEKL